MLLKIVQAGHPVLRQRGRDLTPAEIRGAPIQMLIELMRETMRDAPGVGLAAPQIGEPLRLAVIEDQMTRDEVEREPVPFHVIVNPELHFRGDPPQMVDYFEGCLSVDGYQAIVPRSRAVTVNALDHRGEPVTIGASGWYARILQHEIDHLNGVLYIDRMRPRTYSTGRNVGAFWLDNTPDEIIKTLGDGEP
ncbi:MAG TPA: peptide deformylase [Polyangia bacterium]|nr:peptide deformylase [Polyangia bacterium]